MLNKITAEMFKLSEDYIFIRNLSLTFLIAIASLFVLSDLQSQSNEASTRAEITNMSHSQTKFVVKRK